eukprot:TRINITY_DN15067_c0_g1_i1.p1 TRINITY_DN15067_c0_g1~~TRINITY_DN15067_c0_g1_i1.p1  ORF type:complete len:429 (-),score=94.43 TRINITY_DN15067_c0_g1_i1:26-1138(-)
MALLREAASRTKADDSKAVDPGLLDGLVERYHRDQPAKGANGAMGDNGANGLGPASPQLEASAPATNGKDHEDHEAEGLLLQLQELEAECLLSQLQELDSSASKEDFFDPEGGKWDLEALQDDLQLAQAANGATAVNGVAAPPQEDDFGADSDDEDLQADGLWVIDGETSGEAVIRGDRFFAYRQQRYLVVGTVQRTYDRVVCHIPRDDSRVEAIPGKLWEDTIFWELGETWTRTSEAGYESALAKQVTIQMWNGEKMQDEVLWPQTEFRPVLEALQEGSETLQEEEVKVAKRATWNGKEGCKGELQRSRCVDDAMLKSRGFCRQLRGCPRKAPCRKAVSGLVSGEWPKAACEVDSSRTLRVRRGLLVGR